MKNLFKILAITTLALTSHARAADNAQSINLLYLRRPPVINYVKTVKDFAFELNEARIINRHDNYKIMNPDALAPIMRDYPLVPDNGNYKAPRALRNKTSAAIYSELLHTDDSDLLTEEDHTIVFEYPFLFENHLLILKLAPCKFACNSILNPIHTQEERTEEIDKFLNSLRRSSRFAHFSQMVEDKAGIEKEKLNDLKTLWENM